MARKIKTANATNFINEVISYGGLPVTRATAYTLALEATGNKHAADLFAFGRHIRMLPDVASMTYAEAAAIVLV